MWRKVLYLECKFAFGLVGYCTITYLLGRMILKVLINWIRALSYACFESVDDRNRHDVLKGGSQIKFMSPS